MKRILMICATLMVAGVMLCDSVAAGAVGARAAWVADEAGYQWVRAYAAQNYWRTGGGTIEELDESWEGVAQRASKLVSEAERVTQLLENRNAVNEVREWKRVVKALERAAELAEEAAWNREERAKAMDALRYAEKTAEKAAANMQGL